MVGMTDTDNGDETFILFELVGTAYGVRSQLVRKMEMMEHITPVPNAPPFVEGIVMSRGDVIPAVDLRARFGFDRTDYDVRTRLIVINTQERTVGLIVDAAREFVTIPAATIQPPPEMIKGLSGKYLEGIAMLDERVILILDLEEVINMTDTKIPLQQELAS